jgi:hypothetical protein
VRAWDRGPTLAARFRTWSEEPVITAALWWAELVRRGREAGRGLPPGAYHELRYEDLLLEPEEALSLLCQFLSLPFNEVMLKFHEGRMRNQPGLDAKEAWLPITSGLRDWRFQLEDSEIELFEAAAGDLLEELGYKDIGYKRQAAVRAVSVDRVRAVRDAVRAEMPSHWY